MPGTCTSICSSFLGERRTSSDTSLEWHTTTDKLYCHALLKILVYLQCIFIVRTRIYMYYFSDHSLPTSHYVVCVTCNTYRKQQMLCGWLWRIHIMDCWNYSPIKVRLFPWWTECIEGGILHTWRAWLPCPFSHPHPRELDASGTDRSGQEVLQ